MLVIVSVVCFSLFLNFNLWVVVLLKMVLVDLLCYMGCWYVIVNILYFGECGNVGSYVEWFLWFDGCIDDVYVYWLGSFDVFFKCMQFVDLVVEGSGGGEWCVCLFWLIYVL